MFALLAVEVPVSDENFRGGVSLRDLLALILHVEEDQPARLRIVGFVDTTAEGRAVLSFRVQACDKEWKPAPDVAYSGFRWPTPAHTTLTAALFDAVYRLSEYLEIARENASKREP